MASGQSWTIEHYRVIEDVLGRYRTLRSAMPELQVALGEMGRTQVTPNGIVAALRCPRLDLGRAPVNARDLLGRASVPELAEQSRPTPQPFDVIAPPPVSDVTELIERRKAQFARKSEHEQHARLIPVRIRIDGPVGILHFGDPHVDDDGTDIAQIERHKQLVSDTEGLFAANVGDTTNNWIGRLARLYAQQSTTAEDAWMLAEWFVGGMQWLYIVGGNHDTWSGAGDPLKWISAQTGSHYAADEVRMCLTFPRGSDVVVNARHDFAGSSQWNAAHGPAKAAQMGCRDDILICGHKHKCGYNPVVDPHSGKVMHALQVGSYKVYDRYAKSRGFRDQHISPCVLTVIDPTASHPANRVQVFWEPEAGADYLRFLRSKRA